MYCANSSLMVLPDKRESQTEDTWESNGSNRGIGLGDGREVLALEAVPSKGYCILRDNTVYTSGRV